MTIAGGQMSRAQILRASDPVRPSPSPPQAGGVQVLPTNQSVKVSGMCIRVRGERGREYYLFIGKVQSMVIKIMMFDDTGRLS